MSRTPDAIKQYLTRDQYRLYKLIWERFVASQMASASFDATTVNIEVGDYLFRATGSQLKFPGFLQLYVEGSDDNGVESELGIGCCRRSPRVRLWSCAN